ncbi:MAG TPA: ABC transporter permease [Candidatus Polarisedimenticolia bacterium]|nr:ABC transporter permease [Candidatus Polarisedimenticolia bacterium]
MTGLIVRRLLWMLPVLWAAATLVWVLMFLIPGDPARLLAGQNADPALLAHVRAEWGLDEAAPIRYGRYLGKLARLDLGTSYVQHRRPVVTILMEGFWKTLLLALSATGLSLVLGVGLGAISAAGRSTWLDAAARGITTAAISAPTFWVGLILMLVFASTLGWFPITGYGGGPTLAGFRLPGASHLALPAATLAIPSIGLLARVARASIIEESAKGYARAAQARGASPASTLLRHALANAMLPIVTLAGLNFGHLLGGAIATETIFGWPGIGRVMMQALEARDLPVVEGGVILLTAVFLLVNLAVDLSYAWFDPRIRD